MLIVHLLHFSVKAHNFILAFYLSSTLFPHVGIGLCSSFCCSFLFVYWRLITLQYCGEFCYTFTWISHGCTCVPHPEPPSHLPLHLIPQGHPSTPALSTLSHTSNLDWWSVSHMIIYMFQCYSLIIPPLPSPTESKRLFYTSVSLAVSHIGSLLPSL